MAPPSDIARSLAGAVTGRLKNPTGGRPEPELPSLDFAPPNVVRCVMAIKATIELDAGAKTFASGLLPALIEALRRSRPGDLLALSSAEAAIGRELETWCRFTGNSLVET